MRVSSIALPRTQFTRTPAGPNSPASERIFYREAGRQNAPTLLLLHGFPSSSHIFRHLIPALADRYHLVAPDYPGFGNSAFPQPGSFDYSFAAYARIVERFTQQLGIERYALYIQDYGAPVGLRLALLAPERVTALVVQNGNAYEEGLSSEWEPIRAYWREATPANREKLRGWLNADGVRLQYAAGLSEAQVELLSPDTSSRRSFAHTNRRRSSVPK